MTTAEGSASRGAAGRVAATHFQTRRGLLVAVLFVIAAVVVGLWRGDTWWLPLHLFLIGGVLSAIAATTQMLAITWSSSPPTKPWLAAGQRWILAAGAVGVVVGRDTTTNWLVEAGGTLVIVALLVMVPILLAIRRGAVTDRYVPAIDAYMAAHVFGALGAVIGIIMATDRAGQDYLRLHDAHLTINLFGLVGGVIAATLPYFTATQVRAKMSPRATPSVIRGVVGIVILATAVAALGALSATRWAAMVAMLLYAAALVVIVTLLPIADRKRWNWAGPRLAQLLAGIGWWVAMTVLFAVRVGRGHDLGIAVRTLAIGGFAQILVASLAYLGPVVRAGGHQQLTAGFALTRSWISLAAGNLAAVASVVEARLLLLAALAVWAVDIAARAALLVIRSGSTKE